MARRELNSPTATTPREEQDWSKLYPACFDLDQPIKILQNDSKACKRILPDPWADRLANLNVPRATFYPILHRQKHKDDEENSSSESEEDMVVVDLPVKRKRGRPPKNASLMQSIQIKGFKMPPGHLLSPNCYLQNNPVIEPVDPYEMDEQDENWLKALNNTLLLEEMESVPEETFENVMTFYEKSWYSLVN